MRRVMNSKVTVPVSRAIASITLTVKVTGVRVARARIALGVLLLHVAARVIGCKLDLSLKQEQ